MGVKPWKNKEFTGIDTDYEEAEKPELEVDTEDHHAEAIVARSVERML